MYIWERNAVNVRRGTLHLRRLKLRNLRFSDGSEIRNDTQQPSSNQSSAINGPDRLLSRKLSRRSSEFELDPCQKKLFNSQKENTELQKELSQVYAIKNKFGDLLKVEVEKSCSLEKELKISKSQALTARSESDQSLLEIEKLQRKEDDLMEKVGELQARLDKLDMEYTNEKRLCMDVQKKLEKPYKEVDLYRKVVEKFWAVRSQVVGTSECDSIEERAANLLQDDEGFWSFGKTNKILYDECKQARENLVVLQVECQVYYDSFSHCQTEIEKEIYARKQSETALLDSREQLSCLAELVDSELQQLSSFKASLKEDVAILFLEEKSWLQSLPEALAQFTKEGSQVRSSRCSIKVDEVHEQDSEETSKEELESSCTTADSMHKESLNLNGYIGGSPEVDKVEKIVLRVDKELDRGEDEEAVPGSLKKVVLNDEAGIMDVVVNNCTMGSVDDNRDALAQALQEKVTALLLLSQQEERHLLEANKNVVLESEISSLKQQLLQVTSEKVEALVELARAHEELLKLQEQQKTFKQAYQSGRTVSTGSRINVQDYVAFIDNDRHAAFADGAKKSPAQSYLKQLWQKGPDLGARTKSLSHMRTLKTSKENDPVGIARLRVENATLRESLTSIRHLCKSANRLRMIIARVASESSTQTERSIQAAVDAVDGVISEALHLKVALHSSLPVDDLGWNSIGSPLARASEFGQDGTDYDTNDDLDIVSFFGLEIVKLVLLAAQLQKRFLGQNV